VLFSSRVGVRIRIRVRIRFSVWLANGYAHVQVLLSFIIVTLPYNAGLLAISNVMKCAYTWGLVMSMN